MRRLPPHETSSAAWQEAEEGRVEVDLFASHQRAEDADVVESERTYGGVRVRRTPGERWEPFGGATGEA